jgi:RNA polymerase-binding transcription factor DksA
MDTSHFKNELEQERTKLEQELKGVGRRNPQNPVDWEPKPQETGVEADLHDAADHLEGYAENTAILNDLEARYNEVVAALARIDKGTFGICTVSGEPIEEARLTADPAARTCLKHINSQQ